MLKNDKGTYGVFVKYLKSGNTLDITALGPFHAASTLEHPENPYIIAVFSKNTLDANKASSVIQQVSKTVYDYQSNNFAAINLVLNG